MTDIDLRAKVAAARAFAATRAATAEERNTARLDDPLFQRACALAGLPPTRRQASKWNARRGLARRFERDARRSLFTSTKEA